MKYLSDEEWNSLVNRLAKAERESTRLLGELTLERSKTAQGCPNCGCRTHLINDHFRAGCVVCGHSWEAQS